MPFDLTVVDSFTDRPYAGNPAAVALVDRFPDDTEMQLVAREMNLSETAFVVARSDGGYDLRWFTPDRRDRSVRTRHPGHGARARGQRPLRDQERRSHLHDRGGRLDPDGFPVRPAGGEPRRRPPWGSTGSAGAGGGGAIF